MLGARLLFAALAAGVPIGCTCGMENVKWP